MSLGGRGSAAIKPQLQAISLDTAGYVHTLPSGLMRNRLAKGEKEDPLTRKLLITAAIAVIALTPSIGIGIAEADGMASFRGGVVHGGGIHRGVIHRHGFVGARSFSRNHFGYPGIIGYSDPEAAAEAPTVVTAPQPAPAVVAVDRPPCQETTPEGVVIVRGSPCSRGSP
jgi:hypothetical protein